MADPFSAATKSLHEQSVECIIKATEAAERNEQERVKMYIQQAKMFADMTARKLRAMGMHRQADDYVKNLNEHMNRVWMIAQRKNSENSKDRIQKAKSAHLKVRKALEKCTCKGAEIDKKACTCSEMDKSLQKGFLNPFVGASPARHEYNKTGSVKPTWEVGSVKADPKHSYKMMHELSGEQQQSVQQKYPQGSHTRYAYPVHRETGELIHGQRIPLPPGQAVQAQRQAFKELKPEHKQGAFVQIHSPGHHAHGKKGVVHGPNPNVPGKVKVQIGPSENHSIYLDPHEVKPSRAISKVEKAMQTLFNIRKAFMKSETTDDAT